MDLKNWRGVYELRNIVTGEYYIGSTNDAHKRKLTHFQHLRRGEHHSMRLQIAFNTYGEDAFEFNLIQEVLTEDVYKVEQTYLDAETPYYNVGKHAYGGDNLTNHPERDDIIRRMTESVIARYAVMTPEEKRQLHGMPGDSNPNWKGGVSTPSCEGCGKTLSYGHTHCNKCRPRSGKDNPFYGKRHSEETIQELRESRLGVYKGRQNMPVIVDGCEYRSAGEAGKALGLPMTTVRWRCLSKNQKFNSYQRKQS